MRHPSGCFFISHGISHEYHTKDEKMSKIRVQVYRVRANPLPKIYADFV